MDLKKLRIIYSGKYPRRYFYSIILPISFSIFFGFLIIARILFPGFFSILSNAISDLGNPYLNPFPGWLFFSLAFWSLSALYPPLFLYLHRKLMKIHTIEAKIGTIANYTSIIGMILLGTFPNISETIIMHTIAAILSFGGLGIAIIFYWLGVVHDSIQKALRYHHLGILMILIIITFLLAAISFFGVVQIGTEIFNTQFLWLFEFPFWEWILFIILAVQLLFIGLIIPEQFRRSKSS